MAATDQPAPRPAADNLDAVKAAHNGAHECVGGPYVTVPGRECLLYRLAVRAGQDEAEIAVMRTVPAKMQIVGTWLVEEVDRHTCGTGPDGYYGVHEPQCGLEPIVDLATIPGYPPAASS